MPNQRDEIGNINIAPENFQGLNESQRNDLIAGVSRVVPGSTITGDARGTLQTGTQMGTVNQQSYTSTNPAPISAPKLPSPPPAGTLDGGYAESYVSQKTKELQDQAILIKSQLANTTAGGQFQKTGENQYQFGGSNGFTFSTMNPYTGKPDPELEKLVKENPGNLSDFQLKYLVSSAQAKQKQAEDMRPQVERFNEQQKQGLATAKAAEFYAGRAGTGDPSESVLAKVEQEQSRQRVELDRKVNEILNQAQSSVLSGMAGHVEDLQKVLLEDIPKQLKAEEDAYEKRVSNLVKLQGDLQQQDINAAKLGADLRTNASKIVGDYAKAGRELTDDETEMIAIRYGLDPQDVVNMHQVASDEFQLDRSGRMEDVIAKSRANMKTYLDIADKVGAAVPITLGDNTYVYHGFDSANYQTGTETNKNTGEVVFWRADKNTGEVKITPVTNVGINWELKDLGTNGWWRVSPDGTQWLPATPGTTQTTNNLVYPEGTTPPPRPGGNPANAGQCGSYWGLKTGVTDMPNDFDSFAGKLNYLSQQEEVEPDQIQTGNTFLTKEGSTGHIGFVGDPIYNPTTNELIGFTADESNYVPPGGKKVSYSRFISIKDPKLAGFYDVPIKNGVLSGPDSPTTSFASGLTSTATGAIMTGKPGEGEEGSASLARQQGWTGTTETLGVPIPTIEEFTTNIQEAAGMSMPPEKVQAIYDQTIGRIQPIMDAATVVTSSNTYSKDSREATVKGIKKAVESGDITGAQELLKRAATNSVGTEEQQKIRGRDIGIKELRKLQTMLEEYRAAGGNTNIFKGTEQKIKEKAGTVGSPELRKIATSIASTLIDYRKSVSGAAFTESEKADYAALFPEISNTFELNEAKIAGLLKAWEGSNDSFYESVITPSLYDQVFK